jgi:hypothetical protein
MPILRPSWCKISSVSPFFFAPAQKHRAPGGSLSRRGVPAVVIGGALALVLATTPLLGYALVPTAHATVVEALDLDTLVQESDEVVLARVIKQWSLLDERGRIVTDFQMQVEQSEKGNSVPGSAVVVRKLGGIVGGKGMRISGEPSFSDGELVLLFGTHGKKTYLRPVGMGQGAMRVYQQDGQRWARSDAQGITLTKRGATNTKSRAAVAEPRKLDELLQEVRAIVASQK